MTFLQRLQSHKGGLIRLKTQLYWYNVGDWDNNPGRICLVLDAVASRAAGEDARGEGVGVGAHAELACAADDDLVVGGLLLIDGSPRRVWVAEEDVEVLDEALPR